MFVLMGLTWVTEIISWAASSSDEDNSAVWVVTNVINILRAVFIFIIIICRRQVLRSLRDKFYDLTGRNNRQSRYSAKSTTDAMSLSTVGTASRKPSQQDVEEKKKSVEGTNSSHLKQFMQKPLSEGVELEDLNLLDEKDVKERYSRKSNGY